MNLISFLNNLGLSKRQSDIFLLLSKHKSNTVVELSKGTKFPRSTVYLELERLEKLGLVNSFKEDSVTRYGIVSTENIKYIIEQEKHKVESMSLGLNDVINEIETSRILVSNKQVINTYKEIHGIKQMLWRILTSGETEVIGFTPGNMDDIVDREFAEQWREEFMKRNMHNRIILNKSVPLDWSDVAGFLQNNVEAKTLEESQIKFDRELLIYADTIVIISTKYEPDQYGIEITDKLLVGTYRQLFEFLWNSVAKVVQD